MTNMKIKTVGRATRARGGLRWSERSMMWKLKKGAAVVAIVAIALHSVFTDARQLQEVEVDPCVILNEEMNHDGASRCQSEATTTGFLLEMYKGPSAQAGWAQCDSFILIPGENTWSRGTRGFLYLAAMLYSFLGVAIVADTFMGAIETITSKTYTGPNGEELNSWNPTVANLTLMALGSSAPEILLSVVGSVTALDQPADELGPATIVGSAAFNLLIISAVCVIAPLPEGRKIEEVGVFALTAVCSVWAYIWLLVILKFNTENVVDSWEAILTLLQFPILVWFAYCLDVKWKIPCFTRNSVEPLVDQSAEGHVKKHNYLEYRRNAVKGLGGAPREEIINRSVSFFEINPEYDANGMTADPYCKVTFQGTEHRTKWGMMTLNPSWNEKFVFEVDEGDDNKSITFEVWDHDDITADDFMGEARFNIMNITETNKSANDEISLAPKPGRPNKSNKGSVKVSVMKIEDQSEEKGVKKSQIVVGVISGHDLPGMERATRTANALARGFGKTMGKLKDPWKVLSAAYAQQFRDAVSPGYNSDVSLLDCFMHFLAIFWKVIFCVIPPPHVYGGWPCFIVALIVIGGLTTVVGEIAALFGCVVGLSRGMTAITFVALGTSLPDTFASKAAAQQEDTADAALGNVTGSNSVNVFLGIGLPWTIVAIYQEAVLGHPMPAFSPGFVEGVIVFSACATICLLTLVVRRLVLGYELGGSNTVAAWGCFALFAILWFAYIGLYKYFENNPLF